MPYVNNWATCDQMSPKVFKKRKCELLESIKEWMSSTETYTIRFGMGMLMQHYLDEDFKPEYLQWVAAVKSQEYYVNMMIAWYFATALAKQWANGMNIQRIVCCNRKRGMIACNICRCCTFCRTC